MARALWRRYQPVAARLGRVEKFSCSRKQRMQGLELISNCNSIFGHIFTVDHLLYFSVDLPNLGNVEPHGCLCFVSRLWQRTGFDALPGPQPFPITAWWFWYTHLATDLSQRHIRDVKFLGDVGCRRGPDLIVEPFAREFYLWHLVEYFSRLLSLQAASNFCARKLWFSCKLGHILSQLMPRSEQAFSAFGVT